MNTANLMSLLGFSIPRDPVVLFEQMGYPARLIFLSLILMSCWICWTVVAKGDAQKVRSRVRYLRAVAQTAPLVGFLGTAIGAINGLKAVARQPSPSWHLFSGGMSEAFVTSAIGILVGIAAHWTVTFLNGENGAPARPRG